MTIITPKKVETKQGQRGTYARLQDENNRWMSAFENIGLLKVGVKVEGEITQSGNFTNFKPFRLLDEQGVDWDKIRKEKAEGLAKGAAFNQSCAIAIALYQKNAITEEMIIPKIKEFHEQLKQINTNGEENLSEKTE